MRSVWSGLTISFVLTVCAFPVNAQTVTSVDPPLLGQSLSRPVARINLSGSFGDGRQIADGLAITISDDLYGRGSRTYEFNTSGGVNIPGAIEVAPPTAEIFDAFITLENQINSDPTAPVWAQYYYADIGIGNGWILLVWKYDEEWRLTSGPPNGPNLIEAADPGGDFSVSNFTTNNTDTAPVYVQLQGSNLTSLVDATSVKLRHDVQTSEVYDGLVVDKDENAATVRFNSLAAGSGSPPTFPTLGEYDLEVNGGIVLDKAVTLVANLLDDQTFRLHATGFQLNLQWNSGGAELSPYWRRTNSYPDTDGVKKGNVNRQITPRIYPFATGPSESNSGNYDNEYGSLQWSENDGVHKMWQSVYVDFNQDTTLTLTGLWAANADHFPMTYGAQLRSGDENGTIIAETPPGQIVANSFDWTDFAVSGVFPSGTTEVTVVFYGEQPTTTSKALHVDRVLLRIDDDHPSPPSITGMSTPNFAATGDTNAAITLTGVNLANGQTSVTLRGPDILLDYMSWADVGRKLVEEDNASFARYEYSPGDKVVLTGGPGVILGEYDIAAKDSDYVITLVEDINGSNGDIGGEDVTGYIVKAPLAAGSVNASGTQATATFDLTDAPTGYRNIIVEVGTHDPIVWREGFVVAQTGPNLINGSFELPASFQDCEGGRVETFTPASDWQARFWNGYMSRSDPILQFRDDQWQTLDFPSCPDPSLGIHYHSTLSYEDSGAAQFYQTVTSSPSSTYTLSGFFSHRSEGNAANSVTLELLDGDSTAAAMPGASVEVLAGEANAIVDWTFGYVEGVASSGIMTAAWEVSGVGDEAPHVAHADGLILEECTQPITLTGIDPPAVDNATVGPILLTITGSGFSGASPEVIFATQGQTIFGTNVLVVNDTTLTCEVSDLPAPGAVAFDVIVRSNGCIDSLIEGFVSAPTTIANPGFEEPVAPLFCGSEDPQDPRIPNLEPVSYWNFSDELIREGVVQFPLECPLLSCACPEATTGCDGGHYASMSTGEGEDEVAWQALKVDASAGVVFGGWFSWGGVGNVNIKLVDGYGPDGTLIASTSVPEGNDWCFSSVEGFALSEVITIVWELVDTVNGSPAAVHADSMTFEFSICNDPFADADADGDVDGVDFALFQLCSSGSGNAYPTGAGFEYCQCFDRDGVDGPDGDVDQGDFAAFAGCSSGPDVPADPACDD